MSRLGQQEVGHEGVITGRDAFSLRSLICSLQGLICDAVIPEESLSLHSNQPLLIVFSSGNSHKYIVINLKS
ncbi:hypothetical protein C3943_10425 [Lysinibacillus sp. B2A1]|nr:hypothetical protein C3943_10425 [Lysinibacillus sp. B2A1]